MDTYSAEFTLQVTLSCVDSSELFSLVTDFETLEEVLYIVGASVDS